MTDEVALVRSALHKAMEHLGSRNGHKLPQSASNQDAVLHEYFIATEGEAYFKKRREAAMKSMRITETGRQPETIGELIDEQEDGSEAIVFSSGLYGLNVKRSYNSKAINKTLVEEGLRELGLTEAQVLKFIDAACKERKGATTVRAVSLPT